jgi:hypothetical protein
MEGEGGEGEEGGEQKQEEQQVEQRPFPAEILEQPDLDPSRTRQGREGEFISKGEIG